MNNDEKRIVIEMQSIIDLIIEEQNTYAIDRNLMYKLNELFIKYDNDFDNEFTVSYLNFIETFSLFFDMLIEKLKEYELDLLDEQTSLDDCFFVFNFNEFNEKDALLPYNDMLDSLKEMFPKNILLQGSIFFMHLNALLRRYKFKNNKIRILDKNVVISIDYADRISYFREEYITNFRHELEEGIRTGVFIDDREINNYVREEIYNLENELNI